MLPILSCPGLASSSLTFSSQIKHLYPEGWGHVCTSEGEGVAWVQNRATQLDPSRACSCPAALTDSGCNFQFLQLELTDATLRIRKALLGFYHDVLS